MTDHNYHDFVVAFDLDDTLLRERDFCRSGFRMLCDRERYRVLPIDTYPQQETLDKLADEMDRRLTVRKNPFDAFEDFFRPLAENEGLKWDLQPHLDAYRDHLPDTLPLADGAEDLLECLSCRGIKMALITDGRSNTQRRKIEASGLQRFIDPRLIFISEETGAEKKDSKEMFASVVRAFPEARRFIYVGNNPTKDFFFPNLLGWITMQVPPHPDDVHPPIEAPGAFYRPRILLEQYIDLLKYLV